MDYVPYIQVTCPESSFDELLNFVEMNDLFTCDPEDGGCGKCNYKFHILSTPPHVFTTGDFILRRFNNLLTAFGIICNIHINTAFLFAVLGWQNTCESVDDIRATLTALATEVDIGVLYRGLDPKNRHRLISVVHSNVKFTIILDAFNLHFHSFMGILVLSNMINLS